MWVSLLRNTPLKHQPGLKVLSVSIDDFDPPPSEITEAWKMSVINFIKEVNRNMDLFIFGDELAVINRKLDYNTMRFIDKLDSVHGWRWRRRGNETVVSLDPETALVRLPIV